MTDGAETVIRAGRTRAWRIAVVIPCYGVRSHILQVLDAIGDECAAVFVVDDGCPEGSVKLVEESCRDPRVRVIHHDRNRVVGASVITGYRASIVSHEEAFVRTFLKCDFLLVNILLQERDNPVYQLGRIRS
jgi:glycosyltransferase involved in cell wall biosynthesis